MYMTEIKYLSPPITEAVVEFLSTTKPDEKKCKRAITLLKREYEEYKPQNFHDYHIDVSRKHDPVRKEKEVVAHSFFSDGMTKRAIIRENSFLTSTLAPYTCWADFRERIVRDRNIWQKCVGPQKIHRLGMRYINRIDLPLENGKVRLEDYVKIYPQIPNYLELRGRYTMNVQAQLEDIGALLNINSSTIESPLPNFASVILDFDVIRVFDKVISNDEAYEFLDQARLKKNEVFEHTVTDKTREMFKREL